MQNIIILTQPYTSHPPSAHPSLLKLPTPPNLSFSLTFHIVCSPHYINLHNIYYTLQNTVHTHTHIQQKLESLVERNLHDGRPQEKKKQVYDFFLCHAKKKKKEYLNPGMYNSEIILYINIIKKIIHNKIHGTP